MNLNFVNFSFQIIFLQQEDCGKQCDQIKIAKCLWMLPNNDFTRKMIDFDTFTKIALECGKFGQI